MDFGQIFTLQTFQGLANTINAFLQQQGAKNSNLDFGQIQVYFHRSKGGVDLHIVTNPDFKKDALSNYINEDEEA